MAVTAELIARARAGDGEAFRRLTEPYLRELQVHCYRMLGSLQDAEDALQETLLAAWQGIGGFEGRASMRTWLYQIATNRCLNARRSASRRPAKEWDVPKVEPPEPTRLGEVLWRRAISGRPARAALRDVAARPGGPLRAVRIHLAGLRDRAAAPSAATARRARPARRPRVPRQRGGRDAGLDRRIGQQRPQTGARHPASDECRGRDARTGARAPTHPPRTRSSAEFVSAWESADVDALVALLTDDVFMSMPPMPFEYEGQDAVAGFCASIFGAGRRFDLVPTRANGQPAFGAYLRDADGTGHGTGLYVLTLAGDRICAMTRFENTVLPWFGLPKTLRVVSGAAPAAGR